MINTQDEVIEREVAEDYGVTQAVAKEFEKKHKSVTDIFKQIGSSSFLLFKISLGGVVHWAMQPPKVTIYRTVRPRLLLGRVLLGALLAIALAYVHDTQFVGTDARGVSRPLVNWDVVSQDWRWLTGRIREQWNGVAANQ